MAGGQRIDDHKAWMGGKSKESVLPKGVHVKMESGAEGAGAVMKYEDTTEAIKKTQVDSVAKIKGHQGKLPEYRQ